jgi:RNA polymerase sigma factor (sigma-70 family)
MTDQERSLLAGCLKGEKAAWDAFVLQYSALVYHTIKKTLALYHVPPEDDRVEDLFQEFFLAILRDDFKKLRQFRGEYGCSLASWIRLVSARLTIDSLRKRDALAPKATDPPDPVDSLLGQEEERLLLEAVDALSPKDRIFVDLCFRQSLPPEEIAGIFHMSVGTVYTQKSRILAKLRKTLRKSGRL